MVSLMHLGSVIFKPFSVGIWQSHPLQQDTPSPGFNVYMKENVNYSGAPAREARSVEHHG